MLSGGLIPLEKDSGYVVFKAFFLLWTMNSYSLIVPVFVTGLVEENLVKLNLCNFVSLNFV